MSEPTTVVAVHGLLNELAKPQFVFRMAWPMRLHRTSARTRAENAAVEIDRIVREYVRSANT